MTVAELAFSRDRLREARNVALADAEGYRDLFIAIEEVGRYVTRERVHGGYAKSLAALASLATGFTPFFPQMLNALREARNDAMHLGAAARRTTLQAAAGAIVLEGALAKHADLRSVEHYMVEHPICAERWQTLSMIRQVLLREHSSQPSPLSTKGNGRCSQTSPSCDTSPNTTSGCAHRSWMP